MHGCKKLQDVFVDKKVPTKDRATAVVVADDEKVLWVVGIVSSESCRITQRAGKAVRIVVEYE
jgi:tRNA(Ile)-lysidine synthase